MRILLLSANTGEGHNSTAKAIMEVLHAQEIDCDLEDCLACLSPKFSNYIASWHVRLYKYGHRLMDAGYRAMERFADPEKGTPVYELLRMGTGSLWELLMSREYDAVICVHPFSAMMMTHLRRELNWKIPCYFVATDYTCSPTVEQCDMDGYFIPAKELTQEFVRAGLPAQRLIPSGIPVRQAFYTPAHRADAREKLDIPQDKVMVLLMGGSMGCGPMGRIVRELSGRLPADTVMAVICGSNEKLRESLGAMDLDNVNVVGFTDQVCTYMDAADLIVTKPGGLSTTEAANKHLPMVLINAVGGCENRNFDYFLASGFALGSTDAEEVVTQAVQLSTDGALRREMADALAAAFSQNSALAIVRRVVSDAALYRQNRKAGIIPAENGNPPQEKGGCQMDNQNKVTVINLARSFAGESQARTRYTIYAGIARKEGYEWIARVFEETAANEAVHAGEFLEQLQSLGACAPNIDLAAGYPFQVGTTAENLAFAAEGELHEHDSAYPEFAEAARREGFDDSARLWMQIARIEGVHHNTFRQLYEQLKNGTLTEKEAPITWRCLNCGYTYESIRSCDPCPVCGKEAGWQEGQLDCKMMMKK